MSHQIDPGRIDLVTLDENKNIFKLIVAASHVTAMDAADEDALRQKLTNYMAVAISGDLQERYQSLSGMGCVIQVDVAPNAPVALRQVASEFEVEASSNGLSLTICEIE
jgi:hypothetical protein